GDDVELLQQALEENHVNFEMDVVRTGDKVISRLETGKKLPDVIVMDLNLPKMHGKEILKAVKANKKFAPVPVVILTTSSAKEDVKYCMDNGADEFITKPSTVEGFNAAVAKIKAAATK
ncbi:MAG: response regulator, partial [Chitinophagales bacterium]|nr:response regulator [Chitinophagales bacterium]